MSEGLIQATSKRVRTMADGTLRLTVDIEPIHAQDAFKLFGSPDVPMVLARLTQAAAKAELQRQSAASEKPYGHYAQALYRNGFFFNPKVLQAIGTDEEFREWIQRQPSAYSGKFSEYVAGEGRCVAAHVRRAGESGTAIKAEYACIPLTDEEHRLQHQKGESALGGPEWFDKKRARYVQEWAAHTLAQGWFAVESMGYVEPALMREWALENDLMQFLPGVYKA